MTSRAKSRLTGFTLVELLIVVIILAILAAIVVPQFASSTDDAKVSALDSTLANMRSAIDLYYQQHGEYPGKNASSSTGCSVTIVGAAIGSTAAFLDQLSLYTDSDGNICSVKENNFVLGPYLKKRVLPANPITNSSDLEMSSSGDLLMAGTGTTGGWKFDYLSGKFIANDTTDPDGSVLPYDEH